MKKKKQQKLTHNHVYIFIFYDRKKINLLDFSFAIYIIYMIKIFYRNAFQWKKTFTFFEFV